MIEAPDTNVVTYDGTYYMLETMKASRYAAVFRGSGDRDEVLIRNLITLLRDPLLFDPRKLVREDPDRVPGAADR
ncbi:MAG: hypothetical protein IPL39_12785 [Opitutaceae bacterium]|nr:hypothetical protein [Opitutaceae bacterium]